MSCVNVLVMIFHIYVRMFSEDSVLNSTFSLRIIFKCTVAMNYNILKTEEQS